MSKDNERSVIVFNSDNLFEIEAIGQALQRAGIACDIQGREIAGTFAGFGPLDGLSTMHVAVLESDAPAALEIIETWLNESLSDEVDDAGDDVDDTPADAS